MNKHFFLLFVFLALFLVSAGTVTADTRFSSETTGTSNNLAFNFNSDYGEVAGTFVSSETGRTTQISPYLHKTGTPSFNYELSIFNVDGSGHPTGTALGTVGGFTTTSITSDYYNHTLEVDLTEGTQYAVVLKKTGGSTGFDSSNFISFRFDTSGTNVTSHRTIGGSWVDQDVTSTPRLIVYGTPGPDNFSITAQDSYTLTSLSNFSALINGTTYNTTNGTIITPILDNSTSLYNITISSNQSGSYFNRTYSDYNVSSNLAASLHQAEITFFANNRVSGASVTDFTATAPNSQSNTDTNPRLNVTTGEITYTFNKTGYYDSTTSANLSALETGNATFSVYDHKLNITVNVGSGSASEDNFTIDLTSLNYTYTETLSTTNGWVLFNITDGTYNITLNDSIHELQTETITLNSSVNLTNYEFQARTARTFDIEFFNETTNELLNNTNITVEFISDSNAFNRTTSNGTLLVDLLTPDEYQIKYNIEGSEVIRNYYVTLSEQSYEEIDLYLIDEDISAYYVANVVDASSNACQQNTVSLLRYYVSVNQYKTVEMARTNSQGQAVFRVKPNNVDYKFFFSGSCGDFTSAPTRLIDSSNSYTITGGQELLESLYAISGASTSLTYVNATETFAYSWTSDSNIITQGCLTVQKRKDGARTTVGTQCATGNTGTASITINDTNETTYFASGKLFTSTTFSDSVTNDLEISFLTGFFDNADYAPFAALIIFVAVVLAMGVSASGLVVGSVAALIGLSFFSFIQISTATIFGFITIGVAILYLARGRGA